MSFRSRTIGAVRGALSEDSHRALSRRGREQAARLRRDARQGRLDNADVAVGLELEVYATDAAGRLRRVPDAVLGAADCGPEIGRHNVEINTAPDVLSPAGLRRQAAEIRRRIRAVDAALADTTTRGLRGRPRAGANGGDEEGGGLLLDAMWTRPPADRGSLEYLTAGTRRNGLFFAAEARDAARYYALDNDVRRRATDGVPITAAPGVDHRLDTVMPVSLTASIQPHVQVPRADALAERLAYAVRTMGPVLSLTANSPLLPPDLYGDVTPETALSGPHELRVPVFEDSVNAGIPAGEGNVRVPEDHPDLAAVIDAIATDRPYAPFLSAPGTDGDGYAARHSEFTHLRSTHWRWVRPVFGGDTPRTEDGPASGNDDASVRIEYRPLPTQPTVRDTIACQALVAGLLEGLALAEHPLPDLVHGRARACFYDAVANGPEAELVWLLGDGTVTTDPDAVYAELFEYAKLGLREHGFDRDAIEYWLAPLERRRRAGVTPSSWRKAQVRTRLDDGADWASAVHAAQRAYRRRSRATLDDPEATFADWL